MTAGVTDRRALRHQATRERILDAAWQLAREQGLAGISLRDLAARVDLRQPSLYSYFDSKHALYDAMFAQGYEQVLDAMGEVRLSPDPPRALREAARAVVALLVEDVVRAQLLFQRTIPGFEPSPESYALANRFLDQTRERLAATGYTRPRDVDVYTAMIGGLINQQLANEPGGTRWVRLVDDVIDMYLTRPTAKPRRKS